MGAIQQAVNQLKSLEFKHTCDVYVFATTVNPTTGMSKRDKVLVANGLSVRCKLFQTGDGYKNIDTSAVRIRKNVLMIDMQNIKDNYTFTNFQGVGIDDSDKTYSIAQNTSVMPMTWFDTYGFTMIENLIREDNNG